MRVKVDKAWGEYFTAAINRLSSLSLDVVAELGYLSILYKEAVLFYKFFAVEYFKIFEAEVGITFKTEKWTKNSYSDKKLAEEYILMNKPVLSLEDLLSVWVNL